MKNKKYLGVSLAIMLSFCGLEGAIFEVSNSQEFQKALDNASFNGENDTIIMNNGFYSAYDIEAYKFSFSGSF